MKENHFPNYITAMPEYILSVIRDEHRQQCEYDPEADSSIDLTFNSTIADWTEACDLVSWKDLGHAINKCWRIQCTDKEWESVLKPIQEKKLYGVCELIARHTTMPVIQPKRVLGEPCLSAGTFLTIRSLLELEGANVKNLKPSTPLHEYTRKYAGVFLFDISKLRPSSLPPVKIENPGYDWSVMIFGITWLCIMIAIFFNLYLLSAICSVGCGLSRIMISIFAHRLPSKVEFGNLKTFRDLTQHIVHHPSNS